MQAALSPRERYAIGRKARTRAAILWACRQSMQAGTFRPPLTICCEAAGRTARAGFVNFGSVEALHLEAIDHQPTRDAVIERVLGRDRAVLSDEMLRRIVRAIVTGAV